MDVWCDPNIYICIYVFFALSICTGRQHYRLYAIHHLPCLQQLDYQKIKPTEREMAERFARSAAGAALERDIHLQTFVPGEGLEPTSVVITDFTPEQKESIRELLLRATSVQEIEEIEASVRKGILPPQLQTQLEPATKRQRVDHVG
jgi:U2 small nuclear ribonucleoprotein A'